MCFILVEFQRQSRRIVHCLEVLAGHACCGCRARYMMDSGLAVLSTTNHFFNTSAYSSLTPQSLVRALG